ncbi:MAG TPA: hypothetical protein VGI10_18525 [Polyangiaceae bacterium]|jgi:hypothetical protein
MTMPRHGWQWWALRALAASIFLPSLAAALLGGLCTFFSLTPGTDMADANVLIRYAPPYALGGILGIAAAACCWSISRRK